MSNLSITLNKSTLTLNDGESYELKATVLPSGSNLDVVWMSDNNDVATCSSGTVYGIAPGNTTITATVIDNPNVKASCEVTVKKVPIQSVSVWPASVDMYVGDARHLNASVSPYNATYQKLDWCSSDPVIAEVNRSTGYVQANSVGEVVITAEALDGSKKVGSCRVKVTELHVTGIDVYPKTEKLKEGHSIQLSAQVLPENATYQGCFWESSNEAIATVDPLGKVTAHSPGNVIITATSAEGRYTDTCYLEVETVNKKAIIIVPGIMGTELELASAVDEYTAGTRVWPFVGDGQNDIFEKMSDFIGFLKCDSNGTSIYDLIVNPAGNYGAYNTYRALYDNLSNDDKIKEPNKSVVFFGYDWRQSNSASGELLKAEVDKYDSVVIVAHSMGGLVTSHMLKDQNIRRKVQRVIILGAPFLGSVDTVPGLTHGIFKVVENKLDKLSFIGEAYAAVTKLRSKLQGVAVNIPSLYEILPNRRFFVLDNRYYYSVKLSSDETQPYTGFIATRDNLPIARGEGMAGEFNSSLFEIATQHNDSLWDMHSHITSCADVYYIIGEGVGTQCAYTFDVDSKAYSTTNVAGGDGTVLSYSASMNDMYPDRTFYVATDHTALVKDQTVYTLLSNLIRGNTEFISGVSPVPGVEM